MAKVLMWQGAGVEGGARPSGLHADEFISERARALGLRSLDDLKREVLRQRPIWWAGTKFHCPLCDVDFLTAQRAAEHVVLEQHPVLRLD